MAPTNTRVVRPTAALYAVWGEPNGRDFVYQETLKYDGRGRQSGCTRHRWGGGIPERAQMGPTRHILTRALPKPGVGPSLRRWTAGG